MQKLHSPRSAMFEFMNGKKKLQNDNPWIPVICLSLTID
jgi:hypothetical protein